ncbi:MAG: hypothetical protein ACOX1T_00450 [Saccharofermentanales bacterium]
MSNNTIAATKPDSRIPWFAAELTIKQDCGGNQGDKRSKKQKQNWRQQSFS